MEGSMYSNVKLSPSALFAPGSSFAPHDYTHSHNKTSTLTTYSHASDVDRFIEAKRHEDIETLMGLIFSKADIKCY
jgi:hypothetical protein